MGFIRLDVLDPVGMKARLEQKSMQNFLKVIRSSLGKERLFGRPNRLFSYFAYEKIRT